MKFPIVLHCQLGGQPFDWFGTAEISPEIVSAAFLNCPVEEGRWSERIKYVGMDLSIGGGIHRIPQQRLDVIQTNLIRRGDTLHLNVTLGDS